MRKWLYYIEERDGDVWPGTVFATEKRLIIHEMDKYRMARKGEWVRADIYSNSARSLTAIATVLCLGHTNKQPSPEEIINRLKEMPDDRGELHYATNFLIQEDAVAHVPRLYLKESD